MVIVTLNNHSHDSNYQRNYHRVNVSIAALPLNDTSLSYLQIPSKIF